ncbi:MAG: hypothetical protein J0L63_03085, partial [Anaerolineae bacterium]|nr:hypothetical protein [Anaerolineae bacterium]
HILRSLCKTDEERDAMYALSLMRYIGLDEDASTEGQVVSQFLNLDFKALKRTALQMQRRGLVIKYGRFRYVTPPLLATWFAKEIWEAQQSEIISELFPQLPSMSAQYRLLERLGDIGEESLGEPIIEKLFDSKNALGNIDAIDDQETAHLFRLLSNASPNTSLKILNRIFKKVPRERLLEFKRGRREIIYTLEGLLRRSETFYEAARLLLRLADAENETWGNNASGIWRDIFFTRLGIGTFPAWERHKLIKEAIHHSSSQQIRLLGVKALSAALSGYESRSYGSGPGGYLSKGWRPELWEDIWKTYQSALELIDQLLRDEDIVVANEAISTFINSIRLLLKTPLKLDILKRIEDLLEHLNLPSQKKHLIDTLGHAIKYETNSLTTSEITTFQKWREELLGNSFHDRLHRWVGELNDSDRQSVYVRQETPIDLNAIIKQLALEGYSQPELLHAELEWLSSLNAQYAPNFALELGRLDVETIWLTEWLQLLPNATLCLSYYLYGKSLVTDNHETIEELLNEWRQTRPELAFTVFTTIQLLGGTDKRAKWIVELIERNWLPPEYLIKLSRDWLKPLSDSMFIEFLRILEAKDKSQYTSVMLGLISEWLQTHHEYNRDTTPFILSILNRPPYYDRLSPRYPQAGWYEWRMICLFYLNTFTEEIVKAATHLMKYWDVTPDGPEDDRLYILIEALQIEPEITWSIISNALLDSEYYWPSMHFDMTNSLNTGTLLESVEINVLMNWIDNNKPLAARIASEMIRVEQTPLPTLARNLIINYSDDEIVRNNLLPQKRGMSWAGSRSNRLQKMLDIVHTWLTDENEIVQEWASEVAEDIERDIRQAKRYDDETNLLYN